MIKKLPKTYEKDASVACPTCGKRDKVYHIMPFDYAKYCSRCSKEFMGE